MERAGAADRPAAARDQVTRRQEGLLAGCAALAVVLTAACTAGSAPTAQPAPGGSAPARETAASDAPTRQLAKPAPVDKAAPLQKPGADRAPAVAPEPTSAVPPPVPTAPITIATPDIRAAGSRVEERVFASRALGSQISYLAYLPPGYDGSSRRYPTLYLLHGVAGDSSEWPSIGVPEAADALIAADAIQPMIVLFPNADASYYVNNATWGVRWSDYLTEDRIAEVDAHYRTLTRRESRAVGGLSMGGDGALQLAFRYPDVFGVAGAHSPSSRLLFEHAPADVYGTEAFFRAHNPFWLAQDGAGAAGPEIWIDIGDEDPWRWNARAIHFALEARGIPHQFNELPGVHDADYWIGNLKLYLSYYSRTLAGP